MNTHILERYVEIYCFSVKQEETGAEIASNIFKSDCLTN